MVIKLVPPLGTPVEFRDIFFALKSVFKNNAGDFERDFSDFIGTKYSFLLDSGRNAFFIILKILKDLSDRREVILPAYTCPTVAYSIRRAGLTLRICDVDLNSLSLNLESLKNLVNKRTLCIVPTHLFGIPCANMESIMEIARKNGAVVVEDACQASGASLNGKMVGSMGDIGFFSLGKGKNFTTIQGGIITTNSSVYAGRIKRYLTNVPKASLPLACKIFLELILYSALLRPSGFAIVTKFKNLENIDYSHYSNPSMLSNFQAAVGSVLLKRLNKLNEIRMENSQRIYRELKELTDHHILIADKNMGKAVYPSFPVIVKDRKKRELIYKELIKHSIGVARMYPFSLNKITDIKNNSFCPNAEFISKRLLVLPTNPFLKLEHIKIIGMVFKNAIHAE